MKTYSLIIILLFAFIQCSKSDIVKDQSGVVVSQPPIWSLATTDDATRAANFFIQSTVIYNNGLLISSRAKGNNLLRMINIGDGKILWDWNDLNNKNIDDLNLKYFYKKDNTISFGFNN